MNHDVPLTRHQARRAAWLAALSALLCLGAAVTVAWLGRPRTWTTADDVITTAVVAVATLALVRLAWACAVASHSLLAASHEVEELGRGETGAPGRRTTATSVNGGDTRTSESGIRRSRAAGIFVTLATVTMLGTQAAQAATPPPSPTFTRSTPSIVTAPPRAAFIDAPQLVDPTPPTDTPTPDFTSSSRGSENGPDPAPSAPAAPGLAAVGAIVDASVPLVQDHATSKETAMPPTPGWTPSRLADTPRLVPLALGPVRTSPGERATHHVVTRGENLWSIAASYLAPGAPAEEIAESLSAWTTANPEISGNPDLLRPGQLLALPHSTSQNLLLGSTPSTTTGDLR